MGALAERVVGEVMCHEVVPQCVRVLANSSEQRAVLLLELLAAVAPYCKAEVGAPQRVRVRLMMLGSYVRRCCSRLRSRWSMSTIPQVRYAAAWADVCVCVLLSLTAAGAQARR